MTRAQIVAAARVSIMRGSKSFAAASRLFSPFVRERAWLLYSWCRACDDLADGQEHGHGMTMVADGPARLAVLERQTAAALAGEALGDPPFDALRLVVAETGLPHGFAQDHIAGFALDAAGWQPRSEDDLLRYCYHVAGVVGCMMAVAMGVAPDDDATLDRACDLGLAFQLANIARDVGEDADAGRCYLPRDWLEQAGLTPQTMMNPANRPALAAIVRRLTDLAAAYEHSARFGTPALPFRSAWAVLAAAAIYGAIGRDVARLGPCAWDARVSTSTPRKIGFILAAALQAALRVQRYRPEPRSRVLWQRPGHRRVEAGAMGKAGVRKCRD